MAGPTAEGLAAGQPPAALWPGGFKKLQGGPCLEQTYTVKARPPREWPPGGRLREAVGPGRPQVGLWGQAGEGTTVFYGPHQDEDMNHSITDVQTNPF